MLWVVVLVMTSAGAQAQDAETSAPAGPVAQPTVDEVRLVTSTTEVRRAVYGLFGVAAAMGVVTVAYWFKTGQAARERLAATNAVAGTAPSPRRRAEPTSGRPLGSARTRSARARPTRPESGNVPVAASRSVFADPEPSTPDDDVPWWERDDY